MQLLLCLSCESAKTILREAPGTIMRLISSQYMLRSGIAAMFLFVYAGLADELLGSSVVSAFYSNKDGWRFTIGLKNRTFRCAKRGYLDSTKGRDVFPSGVCAASGAASLERVE